jgi:hypothetical protein
MCCTHIYLDTQVEAGEISAKLTRGVQPGSGSGTVHFAEDHDDDVSLAQIQQLQVSYYYYFMQTTLCTQKVAC